MHLVRHETDEMTDAASRFENPAVLETEPLPGRVHRLDDNGRGVMRVERRGACAAIILFGQQFSEFAVFFPPFIVAGIKHLRKAAPTYVFD